VARPSRCEAPLRLRPATFRYRQEASDTACRGLRYGLIAEEVAGLLPMSSSAVPTARWKASTMRRHASISLGNDPQRIFTKALARLGGIDRMGHQHPQR